LEVKVPGLLQDIGNHLQVLNVLLLGDGEQISRTLCSGNMPFFLLIIFMCLDMPENPSRKHAFRIEKLLLEEEHSICCSFSCSWLSCLKEKPASEFVKQQDLQTLKSLNESEMAIASHSTVFFGVV